MDVFYEKGRKYNCRVKGVPYFRTSITVNGKLHQIYGDGEKDALRKKEELRSKAVAGFNLDYNRSRIGEVFRYWLYDVKRVDENLKASTFSRYDCTYRTHIEPYDIMYCKFTDFTFPVMQKYVTSMYEEHHASTAAIRSTLKVWKMFTKWALMQGCIVRDPCQGLSIPGKYDKTKKTIEIFTEEERKQLLSYMRKHGYEYRTLIELAFATGMRKGELLGLRWDCVQPTEIDVKQSTAVVTHVDGEGKRERYREIWETKTENSVRTLPILPSTYRMLMHHKAEQKAQLLMLGQKQPEYVFTTSEGKLVDPSSLNKSYVRLLDRCGIPRRKFHAIRHTFATEAIRRGVNIKDLQLLMGHSDIQTTYIYVQSDAGSKRTAIELIGEMMG